MTEPATAAQSKKHGPEMCHFPGCEWAACCCPNHYRDGRFGRVPITPNLRGRGA